MVYAVVNPYNIPAKLTNFTILQVCFHIASSFGLEVASHRVLPFQFELIDSQGLCVFQHLDILHLLFIASELLSDQDLHTPGDGVNFDIQTNNRSSIHKMSILNTYLETTAMKRKQKLEGGELWERAV